MPGTYALFGSASVFGLRDAELGRQRRAEELVVRRPHERIVHDGHALHAPRA